MKVIPNNFLYPNLILTFLDSRFLCGACLKLKCLQNPIIFCYGKSKISEACESRSKACSSNIIEYTTHIEENTLPQALKDLTLRHGLELFKYNVYLQSTYLPAQVATTGVGYYYTVGYMYLAQFLKSLHRYLCTVFRYF